MNLNLGKSLIQWAVGFVPLVFNVGVSFARNFAAYQCAVLLNICAGLQSDCKLQLAIEVSIKGCVVVCNAVKGLRIGQIS